MAILFSDKTYRRDKIYSLIKQYLPEHEVRLWPDVGNPEDIDYAIAWYPEPSSLLNLPHLKALFLTSAGVDGPLADPTLPDVPIARCVNNSLSEGMAGFVAYNILQFHRQFYLYVQQQRDKVWQQHRQPSNASCTVGIMGMGEMGLACLQVLQPFGFTLRGWSRSEKHIDGITHFAGKDSLPDFLSGCDIVVCVLPLTDETRGILCSTNLKHAKQGSYLISAGRGAQMVEKDILDLLDKGHIAGAALDVFETEPLPTDNPLWSHPKVILTPHIASITDYAVLCEGIRQQIANFEAGLPLKNVVDRMLGY
jgi:glyoxylate/hydroxypyruvate reductase A